MRLVLDEHLDVAVAVELRKRSHDVIAVTEDAALTGVKDRDLWEWAAEAHRVIVTRDMRGFSALAQEHQIVGDPFAGVIFLSSKRYPEGPGSSGSLIRDLARLLDGHPERDALSGRSIWLGSE